MNHATKSNRNNPTDRAYAITGLGIYPVISRNHETRRYLLDEGDGDTVSCRFDIVHAVIHPDRIRPTDSVYLMPSKQEVGFVAWDHEDYRILLRFMWGYCAQITVTKWVTDQEGDYVERRTSCQTAADIIQVSVPALSIEDGLVLPLWDLIQMGKAHIANF